MQICVNCFHSLKAEESLVCSHCQYDNSQQQSPGALPYLSVLANRYVVGCVRERNIESLTYCAIDTTNKKMVDIQEFFSPKYMYRKNNKNEIGTDHKETFEEIHTHFLIFAKSIQKLKDIECLPTVMDSFSQNETCYIVYEHKEYVSLKEYIASNGGKLDFQQTKQMFKTFLNSVAEMHLLDIEHLGINIESIKVCPNNNLYLSDFSSNYIRTQNQYCQAELYDGCTAYEQYVSNIPCGNRSDIYSIASVIFYTLTGELPNPAYKRANNPKVLLSKELINSISQGATVALSDALQVKPENRVSDIKIFKSELYNEPTTIGKEERKMVVKQVPNYKGDGVQRIISPVIWLFLSFIVSGFLLFYIGGSMINNGDINIDKFLHDIIGVVEMKGETVVKVPSMANKPYRDFAYSFQTSSQYQFVVNRIPEYSNTVAEGTIIRTDPQYGDYVAVGGQVDVYVSAGSKTKILPDIRKMSFVDAEQLLKKIGMVIVIEEQESDSVPFGDVIGYGEGFNIGDKIDAESQVTIIVSGVHEEESSLPEDESSENSDSSDSSTQSE